MPLYVCDSSAFDVVTSLSSSVNVSYKHKLNWEGSQTIKAKNDIGKNSLLEDMLMAIRHVTQMAMPAD